ncbi:response regulator transcription factor [Gordonia terrae]|uniref:helix-turn-helix transcriptional regulator n=1 Tax=Gordonia terrae TaxID=2055 RepID=UPI003F6CB661
MNTGPGLSGLPDHAVAAILDARDRTELGRRLCEAVAEVVHTECVILVEIGTTDVREIARHETLDRPGLDSSPPVEPSLTPAVRDVVKAADGRTWSLVDVPTSGHRAVVVIPRTLPTWEADVCGLLVDLTVATLDRLESEDMVRAHRTRLRALSDDISELHSQPREFHDGTRASEFASAASLLTDRERDILEQLLDGASNATIAETFTLSIETVKTHVKHILRKMGAANRAELISRSG